MVCGTIQCGHTAVCFRGKLTSSNSWVTGAPERSTALKKRISKKPGPALGAFYREHTVAAGEKYCRGG